MGIWYAGQSQSIFLILILKYKKQDQDSTEKHFRKYIIIILFKRKLSFLFKETFSVRKKLILYKMSEKK